MKEIKLYCRLCYYFSLTQTTVLHMLTEKLGQVRLNYRAIVCAQNFNNHYWKWGAEGVDGCAR